MPLIITGKPADIERYKKARSITFGDIDPATGQHVQYALKKFGGGKDGVSLENNPWIKHGPDYRILQAKMKVMGEVGKQFKVDDIMDIAGIANANIVDRMDERVNPVGLDASNFMKNRVLLIDHMYQSRQTVGRVTELRAETDGLHFSATVGDPSKVGGHQNLTQIQKDTRSLIAQGYLQTVSIGFIPKKIRAPVYTDEGVLDEPAVIESFEMLELSIVAVPANPGAVFEAKGIAKTFYNNSPIDPKSLTASQKTINNKGSVSTKISKIPDDQTVQTLVFMKDKFTLQKATEWAGDFGYKADKVDENEESFRLIQRDAGDFNAEEQFKTMELASGVDAVIGKLREDKKEMDETTAKELVDGIKTLTTTLTDGFKKLNEQNEKILGSVGEGKAKTDDKPEDKPEEDEDKKSIKANADAIAEIKSTLETQVETLKQIDVVIGKLAEKL